MNLLVQICWYINDSPSLLQNVCRHWISVFQSLHWRSIGSWKIDGLKLIVLKELRQFRGFSQSRKFWSWTETLALYHILTPTNLKEGHAVLAKSAIVNKFYIEIALEQFLGCLKPFLLEHSGAIKGRYFQSVCTTIVRVAFEPTFPL